MRLLDELVKKMSGAAQNEKIDCAKPDEWTVVRRFRRALEKTKNRVDKLQLTCTRYLYDAILSLIP